MDDVQLVHSEGNLINTDTVSVGIVDSDVYPDFIVGDESAIDYSH